MRLQKSKDNVEQIQKIMSTWSKLPLFERLETKNSSLLNLTDREERTKKRYDEVKTAGEKIHAMLHVSVFNHQDIIKVDGGCLLWK